MEYGEIISYFEKHQSEKARKGMEKFKVGCKDKYGISMPILRKLSKRIGKNHQLALKLWKHGYHESRILSTLIEEPDKIDEKQLDKWVNDFDTWDIVDQACVNLFINMPLAISKINEWAESDEEFVKRTAFSLIATLAVHKKNEDDEYFEKYFELIKDNCDDDKNFVKKAVNWALRSIGKKNKNLNKKAIEVAYEILEMDSKCAKWIARDAIKELESEEVQNRLAGK